MITIITGTPGAGKTLYAIQEILKKLLGTTVTKTHDDGSTEEIPRVIYSNINGLAIEHELIDGSDKGGLKNWHEWAKPGSVIVFDEVQKEWKPRPNGSAVPAYIEALETHRHMGVDFILITQGVNLTDRNMVSLVGQHIHVRRLGGTRTCIVYEWDHASRSLMYSKSIAKKLWRYNKSVFKLYKSAELHTKQSRKLPGIIWFLAAALAVAVWKLPTFIGIFDADKHKANAQQVAEAPNTPQQLQSAMQPQQQPTQMQQPKTRQEYVDSYEPRIPGIVHTAPVYDNLTVPQAVPKPAACIKMAERCDCYTQRGTPYKTSKRNCETYVKEGVFLDFEPDSGQPQTIAGIPLA